VRSVPGCSNVVRCLNVASRPGAACADGDNMHGYRLDLSRRQRRALARNGTSCVHPP
jgi:hypothetical protein